MSTTYGLHRAMLLNRNGTAILFEDRRRTFAELGDRVARLAGALRELGVARGDRVAVLSLNQDRYIELFLGVAWAGAVIVPLNIRWSALENEDALRDCRPKILFVDAAFAAMGLEISERIGSLPVIYAGEAPAPGSDALPNYDALLAAVSPVADAVAGDEDLAGIFYTGGTTGRSKGVMLSHRNLMANARNMLAEGLGGQDTVYLNAAPMFHLANAAVMYVHFLAGGSQAALRAFTPERLAQTIERFRVTDLLLVPTMIQMFVDDPSTSRYDLSSLRLIIYGASAISEPLLERAIGRLPTTKFVQAYGMTELSPCATILPWQDHIDDSVGARRRSGGRPILMVDVRIVDASDKPVPAGVVGEIVARGETVMMGYWERPEETRKAVVDGWMHTGDGGYMDEDGYVYVVDRIKDMIITGGENVYSAEVENCIAQHPSVAQCAVIGIPNAKWGEAVHAAVMRKPGAALTGEEVIAFCKDRIAHYKCPRTAHVQDEPLPLSGAGKILKRELRKTYWEPGERQIG